MDPSGDLKPLEQCFRCGYEIRKTDTGKGVLLYGAEDVLRYGPGFSPEKYMIDIEDIDENDITGAPVMTCSVDCAFDTLSHLFHNNPVQFTIHCIMLAGAYSTNIPKLPATTNVRKCVIDEKDNTLNNDPKKLKRWGGVMTYDEYRKHFKCPYHIDHEPEQPIELPVTSDSESESESDETPETPIAPSIQKTPETLETPETSETPGTEDVVDTIAILNKQSNVKSEVTVESDSDSDSESDTIEHGKKIPDDEDIPTDPAHEYSEIDLELIPTEHDPDAGDEDFDFIEPNLRHHFDTPKKSS